MGPAARRVAGSRSAGSRTDLDEATEPDPDVGEVDHYGYVFIVTHGRSGSTLLNGVLNTIPGYLIRGENQGYLYSLYRAHKGALARRRSLRRSAPTTPQHPWFGIEGYPPRRAVKHLRALVLETLLRPEADSRVLGFKEIRYRQEDVVDYLAFIRTLFPGARFVFNSRDAQGVLSSEWWADKDAAELEAVTARLREAEQAHHDVSFHVHYDDYKDEPERLAPLFEFLGEPFDVEALRAVMALPHSY